MGGGLGKRNRNGIGGEEVLGKGGVLNTNTGLFILPDI